MAATPRPAPGPLGTLLQAVYPLLVVVGVLTFGVIAVAFALGFALVFLVIRTIQRLFGVEPKPRTRSSIWTDPQAFQRWYAQQMERQRGGARRPATPPEAPAADSAGSSDVAGELEEFHGSLDEYMRQRKGRDA